MKPRQFFAMSHQAPSPVADLLAGAKPPLCELEGAMELPSHGRASSWHEHKSEGRGLIAAEAPPQCKQLRSLRYDCTRLLHTSATVGKHWGGQQLKHCTRKLHAQCSATPLPPHAARGPKRCSMDSNASSNFRFFRLGRAAKSCGSKPVPVPSPAATQKAGRVTGSPPAAGTAPCAGQPAPLLCPRASAEHRAGQGIARLGRTKSHPTWKLCAKIPYHLSSSGSRSMAACACPVKAPQSLDQTPPPPPFQR